jgi:hypothetical protein
VASRRDRTCGFVPTRWEGCLRGWRRSMAPLEDNAVEDAGRLPWP